MTSPLSGAKLAALIVLSAANFVIGMGAFMVVGMNTPIAAAFGVDAASAGNMMTVYALVYAIASPLLVASVGPFDRRNVMLTGMGLFLVGAAAAALSPNFWTLLVARAVMAVGAGLVTPIAASIGIVMAPPERRGFALSLIFGGMTLAQVFGVPVGAWLSYTLGWQTAFLIVVGLSGAAFVLLLAICPRGIIVPPTSLSAILTVLSTPRLGLAVAFTAILMSSTYVVYTYLAPLFEVRQGLGRDGVTAMLVIFGLGAVVGNIIGGQLTDRIGPRLTLIMICCAEMVLLPAITELIVPLWVLVGVVAIWSVCTWAFMVPQQARLASLDLTLTPVLFALNAAAIYAGASIGAAIGGQVLRHGDISQLGIVASAISALALVSLLMVKQAARPA